MARKKSPRSKPASNPNCLEIGGHQVTLRRVVDCTGDEGHALYGYYSPAAKEIVLDRALEGSELVDTYIHEIMEAVNHITNFDMPHYVIQTVSTLLAQALVSHGTLTATHVACRVDQTEETTNATKAVDNNPTAVRSRVRR